MSEQDVSAAAERLLDAHRRYEDTDTDSDGRGYTFAGCEIDSDDDWPCDTAIVAQFALDAALAARATDRAELEALRKALEEIRNCLDLLYSDRTCAVPRLAPELRAFQGPISVIDQVVTAALAAPAERRPECTERGGVSLHYVKEGESVCGCRMRMPAERREES